MSCSGVTYNLTNTGCNDASKLNRNFTDLCTSINTTETTINASITGIYQDITNIETDITNIQNDITNIEGQLGLGGVTGSLSVAFNGGLGYVKTGYKSYIEVPFDLEFKEYSLYCGETGAIYVDIRKTTHDTFPADGYSDSMVGYTGIYNDLSIKSTGSVTGWAGATGAQDDVLSVYVAGATGIHTATLNLKYVRT